MDVFPPPPRRFAPVFKIFRPRRRDDLLQFKKFRHPTPPVRRLTPTEDCHTSPHLSAWIFYILLY